jgi:asparagine synthase (glutamine-hydrolysing)
LDRAKYYEVTKVNDDSYLEAKSRVKDLFILAVKKRIGGAKKIGILFSGGTDSTLMALTLKELGVEFTCYTASILGGNITEGDDIYYARKIAKECSFDWKLVKLNFEDVENTTKEIIDIIESRNYTKISVALPLFVALKSAKEDGVDFMFTGIGSEEVFADYRRDIDVDNINEICLEGLKNLWIRDLYRDYALAFYTHIELKFPFLDDDFVDYSIRIDSEYKINKVTKVNKIILRDILREL